MYSMRCTHVKNTVLCTQLPLCTIQLPLALAIVIHMFTFGLSRLTEQLQVPRPSAQRFTSGAGSRCDRCVCVSEAALAGALPVAVTGARR